MNSPHISELNSLDPVKVECPTTQIVSTDGSIPAAGVDALTDSAAKHIQQLCRVLWDAQLPIAGPVTETLNNHPGLDLLAATRSAGLATELRPDALNVVVESAQAANPADAPALHASAVTVVGQPAVMRWITSHAGSVADSPNWRSIAPGLGGVTVSVALAEEALFSLMKTRKKLPPELTGFVQLNPWYSRRFAIRHRRRMKGKRLRVGERGATLRGWAHGRTILDGRLPAQWTALHGRGVGRPLDWWSERLLADYTDLLLDTYGEDGIPAAIAPLFVIACASIVCADVPESVATKWDTLPVEVENQARELVGLPQRAIDPARRADVAALTIASRELGDDTNTWQSVAALAYDDGLGMAGALSRFGIPSVR